MFGHLLAFVNGVILVGAMVLNHTHIARPAFTGVDVVGIELDAGLDVLACRVVDQLHNCSVEAHLYCKLLNLMVQMCPKSMVTIMSTQSSLLLLVLTERVLPDRLL